MKNSIKIGVIILGLATTFQSLIPVNSSKIDHSCPNEVQHCYLTVDNSSLSNQMAKSETITHNFSQLPTTDFKNKSFLFQNPTSKNEPLNKVRLSTYIDFSELIYHRLQPFTLIFPFNYFW